jgi:hypothetical protein
MGLDVSHDCWHGAYSAFHRFRIEVLATVTGERVDYSDYDRYTQLVEEFPMREPLREFLLHSDCEGTIERASQIPMADALDVVADAMESKLSTTEDEGVGHIALAGGYVAAVRAFAAGLRLAYENNETVGFS